MSTQKHLNLEDRYIIQHSLEHCLSFKAIGRGLNKDCTTISKEVKNHCVFRKSGAYGRPFNNCIHRKHCDIHHLCKVCKHKAHHSCKTCNICTTMCHQYKVQICVKLSKPPYVCNGCIELKQCTLEKAFYNARDAQKEYEAVRTESRTGITITENEVTHLDKVISPLIRKGLHE